MAKAKKRGEQTRGVRELLRQNRKMATKDIIAAMAAKGIRVKPQTVYVVKSYMKTKRRRQKREKIVATGNAAGIANPIELVRKVKALAIEAGGLGNLKQLVEVMGE